MNRIVGRSWELIPVVAWDTGVPIGYSADYDDGRTMTVYVVCADATP